MEEENKAASEDRVGQPGRVEEEDGAVQQASVVESEPEQQLVQNQVSRLLCSQHSMSLTHFCFTCSDLVCTECFNLHTHSSKIHRVTTLADAKRVFAECLAGLVAKADQRRMELVEQVQLLINRAEEVRRVSRVIELDQHIQQQGVLQRLNLSEAKAQGEINIEIVRLQKIHNQIDDLLRLVSHSEDKVQLLLRFRHMAQCIEEVRTFQPKKDFPRYQLANEVGQFRTKVKLIHKVKQWSAGLDLLIVKVMEQIRAKIAEIKEKRNKDSRMPLPKELRVIRAFQLVCVFCGQFLAQRSVNQPCIGNGGYIQNRYGVIDNDTAHSLRGTRRHFWSQSNVLVERGKIPALGRSLSKQEYYLGGIRIIRDICLRIRYKMECEHKKMSELLPAECSKVQFMYKLREYTHFDNFQLQFVFTFFAKQNGLLLRSELEEFTKNPEALLEEEQKSIEAKTNRASRAPPTPLQKSYEMAKKW